MRLKEGTSEKATERRLLETAGEVFAEKGYRAATVREIIRRAKANVAAVNYHFGDKAALYTAAFRLAAQERIQKYPVGAPPVGMTAQEKLGLFVRTLLSRVLSCDRPAWTWQIMMREMADPSGVGVLDEMVRELIAPDFKIIAGIVSEISGVPLGDARLRMCVGSVIGQVMFYRHAQPIWQRLHPEQKYGDEEIEALAEHIAAFSVAGLKGMKSETRNPKSESRGKSQ